ncbi:MAG: 4'-phosphopantetheinyl transferase superfamily protein [Clostridiales bacterium]|nr:4'-phosphopantetheinyl transferase superfamily protein [Clostridiales bacterium]
MAVFAETEIGCDIEYKKRPNDKLARRFFCPEEYEWLTRPQSQAEKKDRFYRLWTLKESFLKATGLGLYLPLDSFCFHIEEDQAGRTQIPFEKGHGGRTQISFEEGEETEDQNQFLIRRAGTTANVRQQVNSFQYEFAEYQFGEYCAAICLCDSYGE